MGDIKNPKTQIDRVVFNQLNDKVFIGGGKSDAKNIVGEEFADITGGTNIGAKEIDDILEAILTSKGWSDSPGLEGVELVSLTTGGFTIAVDGAGGSTDYFEISGDVAEAAVTALAGSNIDIKNNKSQFAIFDTDAMTSIFIGGGKSDARNKVGQEFADITGGTRIGVDEVGDLVAAVLSGKGWSNPSTHGLEGVELASLTGDEIALSINGAGPTTDTILFTGEAAENAIEAASKGLIDIKNNKTQVGVFDFDDMSSIFIGGGKSNARNIVSEEFADITGGTRISQDEALDLFEAITSGGSWQNPASNGVDGVELVGLTEDSFTIAIDAAGPSTDYIIFENVDFGDAIA